MTTYQDEGLKGAMGVGQAVVAKRGAGRAWFGDVASE